MIRVYDISCQSLVKIFRVHVGQRLAWQNPVFFLDSYFQCLIILCPLSCICLEFCFDLSICYFCVNVTIVHIHSNTPSLFGFKDCLEKAHFTRKWHFKTNFGLESASLVWENYLAITIIKFSSCMSNLSFLQWDFLSLNGGDNTTHLHSGYEDQVGHFRSQKFVNYRVVESKMVTMYVQEPRSETEWCNSQPACFSPVCHTWK